MNILLVDDQKTVIDGLLKGIHWDNLGITNVYKAYNASDAKALFNNVSIDILLTDIEMPGESGLKLVEWVRDSKLHTKCIFLTSHADFQYAQYAIKMGGLDYILEPCPYEEIEDVIRRAIHKAEADDQLKSLRNYGQLLQNDYSMQELIFYNYIHKNQSISYLEPLIGSSLAGVPIKGYLTLFQIRPDSNDSLISDSSLLTFSLHNILKEKMEETRQQTFFCEEDTYRYVLFTFSSNNEILTADSYHLQLDALLQLYNDLLNAKIAFEISSDLISLAELSSKHNELIIQMPPLSYQERSNVKIDTLPPDPVQQVKDYVANHIEEDISRTILSNFVHLNSDYLARLFKAETGYTLNDYIVDQKMKRAQVLIRTTLLPIGLIASKVGYDNFSYFSKLYKKIIGISPTEERSEQ